jgi:catalase
VALLPSAEGAAMLVREAVARDFVADAFAHLKIIGHTAAAEPLLAKAGVLEGRDAGFVPLGAAADVEAFVAACRLLRVWEREPYVRQA